MIKKLSLICKLEYLGLLAGPKHPNQPGGAPPPPAQCLWPPYLWQSSTNPDPTIPTFSQDIYI